MENLPLILAALACPVGMGAMMFFMMRPGKRPQARPGGQDEQITQLRDEVARLRAEQEHQPGSDHASGRVAP